MIKNSNELKIYEFIKSDKVLKKMKEGWIFENKKCGEKAIHSKKKEDKFVKNSLKPHNFVKI